ncbi:conserved hypothetical protein [Frankia canadensis]|uniref:Uncharacterized protein n=1 Tax=Frankia canadensis TaxID=1836972 RepID=A0A2I2KS54_9ACTN|nr:hypothetical protein [Frankia canadensis]SNQ48479.1 conserved hypothetical protein [Frankia canadensis]SOU55769.1 conserved hypothetical protein [Frankia canadensis]
MRLTRVPIPQTPPADDLPTVVLEYDGNRWAATHAREITIGRERTCDITLPSDTWLSRLTASVRVLDDCVLVYNRSASKPISLRPPVGEDLVIRPGGAATPLPVLTFDIVANLVDGGIVAVHVDASALGFTWRVREMVMSLAGGATSTMPITLRPAESKALTELCRPLLSGSGPNLRSASYEEVGTRLKRSPAYIRNVITGVRLRLQACGLPGLDTSEDLARWLINHRVIAEGDL